MSELVRMIIVVAMLGAIIVSLQIQTVDPAVGLSIRDSVREIAQLKAVDGVSSISEVKKYLQMVSSSIQEVNPFSGTYFKGVQEYSLLQGLHLLNKPVVLEIPSKLEVGGLAVSFAALVRGSGMQ